MRRRRRHHLPVVLRPVEVDPTGRGREVLRDLGRPQAAGETVGHGGASGRVELDDALAVDVRRVGGLRRRGVLHDALVDQVEARPDAEAEPIVHRLLRRADDPRHRRAHLRHHGGEDCLGDAT